MRLKVNRAQHHSEAKNQSNCSTGTPGLQVRMNEVWSSEAVRWTPRISRILFLKGTFNSVFDEQPWVNIPKRRSSNALNAFALLCPPRIQRLALGPSVTLRRRHEVLSPNGSGPRRAVSLVQ